MLSTIVTFLIGYWILLSVIALYYVKKIQKYFQKAHPIEIKESWKGFVSQDFCKWDEKAIISGCFLRFPYNFTLFAIYLTGFVLLININKLFGNKRKDLVSWITGIYGNFAIRQIVNIAEQ